MADTYKVLAQSNPGSGSLTTVYTAASPAVVSTVVVCNQSSSTGSFRLSVQVAAAGDTTKQYLYYDVPIAGNDTFVATLGITMNTGDLLSAYVSSTSFSINVFGAEIA